MPARAKVLSRGIDVGAVTSVTYDGGHALVAARIDKDAQLQEDSRAELRQDTLLGEIYVAILPPAQQSTQGLLRAGSAQKASIAAPASAKATVSSSSCSPSSGTAAILSGAFLTFAIVIGEFTLASLLNRPAFGPYLQLIGANRAYEPSALAVMAFVLTWACMGLINVFGRAKQTKHGG